MLDRIDVKYFKLAVGLDNIGKETDVDITARCPVCGDSKKNKYKKRLHLYRKGTVTNVNCFNGDCSVQNKTVYSFLRDFFPALIQQYKKETFGNTMEKLAKGEVHDVFSQYKKDEKETAQEVSNKNNADILTQDLSSFLKDIKQAPEALAYLNGRGISYDETKYGNWYFGFQDIKIGEITYKITNAIVIPLYYNGEMYGFYSRNIHNKTFYTYMNDANIGYKIWNWFEIDPNKEVYIFEAIFDALSSGLDNVIASIGATIPDERISELKQPVFVLDNDKTGMANSLKYAERNMPVYIQPQNYDEKDMNKMMLNHPGLNLASLIKQNIYDGISAVVRIKNKL